MYSSDANRKQDKKAFIHRKKPALANEAREFVMTMVPDMVLVADQDNMHTMHQRLIQVKTIYV